MRAVKRSRGSCFNLFKALVGVYVVQPGETVVVQDQGGGVEDQLGCGT